MNAITIEGALSGCDLDFLRLHLRSAQWIRGSKTAGRLAAAVKNNWQADEPDTRELRDYVHDVLKANELFQALVMPTAIGLMVSKYETGSYYGTHVDDALMAGVRRDVSFTISLSDPDEYRGGELVIEGTSLSEQRHKLAAGDMIVYPATRLHRVEPVTEGTRLVIVGWARSLIRCVEQRELLFELGLVRSSLANAAASTNEINLLSKTIANLKRMWMAD